VTGRLGLALVAGVLLVGGLSVAGYFLGASAAPTADDGAAQRSAAFQAAQRAAARSARERGFERGRSQGLNQGREHGHSAGANAGTEAGDAEVADRDTEAAAEAEAEVAAAQPEGQATADLPDYATTPGGELICDGAIANDAHYQACLQQSP
jgi:hypothetical protein